VDSQLLQDLTALPWHLQLVLGAGYCAYLIAYVGLRRNHRPMDTLFAAMSFGLIAATLLYLARGTAILPQAAIAFGGTIAAGVIWRAFLRDGVRALLRSVSYSWADESASAWDCLQENSRFRPTQLTVETDDGWCFHCSDAARVKDLPFGPFVLGTSGDVLMYADRSEPPGAEACDVPGAFDGAWGNQVTYLPKERVRRVAIRFTSAAAAEGRKGVWAWARAYYWRRRHRQAPAKAPGG
jgi:hypothetical protein